MSEYNSHLKKIFGDEKVKQLQSTKVLLVGAGGIGCELLKDLILMNYSEIHIVDLDTIDLSNLNRQFLFRPKDIKQSKSLTAVKAVSHFNHSSRIIPYHGSIMDTAMFPISWFNQFDIIFNALDNLEARVYVNKIALFTRKLLMESGTTGLKGQSQPIFPYKTECFQCVAKETPKTFPVCTIRSTPSKPIHCITWAKDFLFLQLFGEDSTDPQDNLNDEANIDTDNKDEKEALLRESNELLDLKKLITENSNADDVNYIYSIIDKIFKQDIERLCMIDTLWKSKTKPEPLNWESLVKEFDSIVDKQEIMNEDQKTWSELENLLVLIDSIKRLTKRFKIEKEISFDKDDVDTLDFVVAAANLRSLIFHIPTKSKFETKQIAGNIIPAVATTNAIMAGFSALESIHNFESDPISNSRMVYDSEYTTKFIAPLKLTNKNPNCPACSLTRSIIDLNVENRTLNDLRDYLLSKFDYSDDISITVKGRLLYDYDFEDNLNRTFQSLNVNKGDIIFISDSDDILDHIELYIDEASSESSESEIKLLSEITIPKMVKKSVTDTTTDEDDIANDVKTIEDANGVVEIIDDDNNDEGIEIIDEDLEILDDEIEILDADVETIDLGDEEPDSKKRKADESESITESKKPKLD